MTTRAETEAACKAANVVRVIEPKGPSRRDAYRAWRKAQRKTTYSSRRSSK